MTFALQRPSLFLVTILVLFQRPLFLVTLACLAAHALSAKPDIGLTILILLAVMLPQPLSLLAGYAS